MPKSLRIAQVAPPHRARPARGVRRHRARRPRARRRAGPPWPRGHDVRVGRLRRARPPRPDGARGAPPGRVRRRSERVHARDDARRSSTARPSSTSIHSHLEWSSVIAGAGDARPRRGDVPRPARPAVGDRRCFALRPHRLRWSRSANPGRPHPDVDWAIVHNGPDAHARSVRAAPDSDALCFVGRVAPEKGIVEAIEIAQAERSPAADRGQGRHDADGAGVQRRRLPAGPQGRRLQRRVPRRAVRARPRRALCDELRVADAGLVAGAVRARRDRVACLRHADPRPPRRRPRRDHPRRRRRLLRRRRHPAGVPRAAGRGARPDGDPRRRSSTASRRRGWPTATRRSTAGCSSPARPPGGDEDEETGEVVGPGTRRSRVVDMAAASGSAPSVSGAPHRPAEQDPRGPDERRRPGRRAQRSARCSVAAPRSITSPMSRIPWVTGRIAVSDRTGSVNSSVPRTKPEKKTDASRTSSESWTAWRSESETAAISSPRPERGKHEQPDDPARAGPGRRASARRTPPTSRTQRRRSRSRREDAEREELADDQLRAS